MLIDVEQVMRLAFRPVGQTELQRWLADLSTKDGVPSLMRETPPAPDTIVDVVGARPGSKGNGQVDGKSDGQDSGLVLDLGDAIVVTAGGPPPRPNQPKLPNLAPYPHAGPTEVMAHPPDMSVPGEPAAAEPIESVLPWYRRRISAVARDARSGLRAARHCEAVHDGPRAPLRARRRDRALEDRAATGPERAAATASRRCLSPPRSPPRRLRPRPRRRRRRPRTKNRSDEKAPNQA